MLPPAIHTLIFDLGGVIIDIDPAGCFKRFQQNAISLDHPAWQQGLDYPLFKDYEMGLLSNSFFLDELRSIMNNYQISDQQLIELWNTMLIDISMEKLNLFERLRENYKLVLLSNTNYLHMKGFNSILKEKTQRDDFAHWFDEIYFSFQMGVRKPSLEIYQMVLEREQSNANELYFLDDNAENIRAANSLGIQTKLISHPNEILTVF
ncbi:HAD family hydrolase [Fulvivirgaceae bacterium LMO-SS25]